MKNPFPDNSIFSEYLSLRDYFKQYQTKESQKRKNDFVRIGRILQNSGETISFDILGSVNFGMAETQSDIDMVVYFECDHLEEITPENCPRYKAYERLILTTLVHEVAVRPYKIEIVDVINLNKLCYAIENKIYDDNILARFVFYRIICRAINRRVLRPYEQKLKDNTEFLAKIENELSQALASFNSTSNQTRSFQKYVERLKEMKIPIPYSMIKKIIHYTNTTSAEQENSDSAKNSLQEIN